MTPRRRRDRHGRGIRGPLAPREVPLSRSRAESFDELVLDAVEQVEHVVRDDVALAERVAAVELGVEDVPPEPTPTTGPDGTDGPAGPEGPDEVPLGRTEAAAGQRPARLVVYRRPLELRATDAADRVLLVHEVVVDLLADLLGVDPDTLDDEGDDSGDDGDRGDGDRGPGSRGPDRP